MEITWYGHSCFRMMERGIASIVADPYGKGLGYPEPQKLKGDIVTVSHDAPGHSNVESVKGAEYVLTRPGEYEIGGVFITGVATYNPDVSPEETRRNTVFVYDFDNFLICHLGDLDHVPSQSEVEALGSIDVLLIPVGGGKGLDSSQASDVISLIEPAIVVPMHYKVKGAKVDLDPVDNFLKEMGLSQVEQLPSLKIAKSNLTEDTQIIVLENQAA